MTQNGEKNALCDNPLAVRNRKKGHGPTHFVASYMHIYKAIGRDAPPWCPLGMTRVQGLPHPRASAGRHRGHNECNEAEQ
jgi:hypothetical protein